MIKQASSLVLAKQLLLGLGAKFSPSKVTEEEQNPHEQDDLSLRVTPIEPLGDCLPVPFNDTEHSASSDFSFFEDGKQRTVQIGFLPVQTGAQARLLPVHYYTVGAVILERKNRKLRPWKEAKIEEGIVLEKSMAGKSDLLKDFADRGLKIEDVISTHGCDYYELKRLALQKAKSRRLKLEQELIQEWRHSLPANDDRFLVVDGTLMNLRGLDKHGMDRCIGVSKSFGSRYFSQTDHARILQMDKFQRSWSFCFHSDKPEDDRRMGARDRVSWYLRLRKLENTDPEFGLIRVEISEKYKKGEDARRLADKFSVSLIAESLPVCYPNPRWDKLLYPIAMCEDYLSSMMPSIGTINASMGGQL